MYLAVTRDRKRLHFVIRESVWQGGCWRSRDLADLGPDPAQHIVYPGGHAYYVDPALEDRLQTSATTFNAEALDDLLWPFVDADVRYAVGAFRKRRRPQAATPSAAPGMVHIFDKRRLHFLRFGQMDQGRIGRMPAKFFQTVRDKSRDEIEQHFLQAEQVLKPHERKAYVYVIFDLQRFFSALCAKTMPQGLDPEAVDEHFVAEICRLDGDARFWAGHPRAASPHPYLVRYLIMYFDSDYGQSSFLEDLMRQFMDRHRRHRPPPPRISLDAAAALLGIEPAALGPMTRREVTRRFRRKALALHPDQGGDHRAFINLAEAYREILRRKPRSNLDR